jgi:peroxiredoxin
LRDEAKEFDRRGARLVAVAPHHAYHVRRCVGEDGPFPVLADPALTVSATYGAAFGLFER